MGSSGSSGDLTSGALRRLGRTRLISATAPTDDNGLVRLWERNRSFVLESRSSSPSRAHLVDRRWRVRWNLPDPPVDEHSGGTLPQTRWPIGQRDARPVSAAMT
jgi:hypothetical protein